MENSTSQAWQNEKFQPRGLINKLVTLLAIAFTASAQTALAYSTDTPTQNAGWGDHNYFDRHTLDCGLGGMSRVKLHVSAPVGWTASGLWDFHYDCDAAYQDGSVTKYTGWNHDGNGNVIFLDRHGIDCGNKPLQYLKLQTTSGDRMRYQYKCGTSSLSNVTHHYTPANDDGQGDRIAWNGIYLDRHNVDCPSGKVLTYMRLQRPSSNTIRYHYKCGRIGANATTRADTTKYPVVFIHGMGGKAANFADSFGNGIENSPWMGSGQQILRVQTSGLNHSEYRGHDVYNQVVSYMTATGATKVNMVGHSQGGLDMRKVAHMLKNTAINGSPAGVSKVGVMLSLQSPHRGSPVADTIWSLGSWANPLVSPIFNLLDGNGGDGLQFWDAIHQLTRSSMTHFNNKYPSEGVANYVGSFLTAQEHSGHNDWVARSGMCKLTVDNMYKVLGQGSTPTGKDDCLVSVDREQMGYRLVYNLNNCSGSNCSDPLNTISQTGVPYVSNLNNPGAGGNDTNTGVMNYDHFDMINSSISADDGGFDEHEFYAAIVDFIASKEGGSSAPAKNNSQSLALWSPAHNRYMVAEGNGGNTVNANRTAIGPWETFTMTAPSSSCIVNGSIVIVRTGHSYYWSAQSNGALDADRTNLGSWEKFVVVNHSDSSGCLENNDLISLRSNAHNRYVAAESNGTANANRTGIGSWEKFRVHFR